jgi:dTDP-4-amino-4,6-dideoxygalactose transaminase
MRRCKIKHVKFIERVEIIREKVTNRRQFFRGQINKHICVVIGLSCLPSEIIFAFLWVWMKVARKITQLRSAICDKHHASLNQLEAAGVLRRPIILLGCTHNAHMYYGLLDSLPKQKVVISLLAYQGIGVVFNYVPLNNSPAGKKYGRLAGKMNHTNHLLACLIRLPLLIGKAEAQQDSVIDILKRVKS